MNHLKAEPGNIHRIATSVKSHINDPAAAKIVRTIREFLFLDIASLKILNSYTIHKRMEQEQLDTIAETLFIDPVIEELVSDHDADWRIEVSLKPGMTDNAAKTAQLTIEDYLGEPIPAVTTSKVYLLKGNLDRDEVELVSNSLLANALIHDISITAKNSVHMINLDVSDSELINISKERQLALSLEEMQAIRDGFKKNPTDVELEAIAQTWSEHCKHKIFNAKISYTENGKTETIDSLFRTYIKAATEKTKKAWLVSVFSDNAGIIRLDDVFNLAFKVETHNSPSALDPYGGALTGILGVNRDIMGAGIGARLVANTDVFCFAPPNYSKPIPKRLHHPKRVFEGVRLGVEHGGNKSGVPTLNGSIFFDERFLGKPLVYCGSVGIMPTTIRGKPSHIKTIHPEDLIVIAGGRTGRDGIHGATFSSQELHAGSPSSAVQIGDPFTQKKLHDFLLEARDQGLYNTLTDNGAGGFSSSVGELAELSRGCEIHLDRALLKQPNMLPWEILLSESQERMTLAVSPAKWQALQKLAQLHEVEVVAIGTFTSSGFFHVLYHDETVAKISLQFLHQGVPQMQLKASWSAKAEKPLEVRENQETLLNLLASYNICSKETIVRQYDHEVQGGTILKPMVGNENDGPSDAALFRTLEAPDKGIILSHGLCPRYSDHDAYHMAANAVDEAIRNAVAIGATLDRIAILDNFCWPDPIENAEKNPDGAHKLAQLVRANKALYDAATAYGTPIISGKDSMKNDYIMDGIKISIPPTLLVSAIGVVDSIANTVSMDVKAAGDLVYVLGVTRNELGCSEYAALIHSADGMVPKVNFEQAKECYQALYKAIQQRCIASCHDCSDGGLAVALAESAFAGGYGMEIDPRSDSNGG